MSTPELSPEVVAIRQAFGTMVRNMRKARGLSQAALGRLAGIGPSMISQIESGVCGTTLDRIALLLGAMEEEPVITTQAALEYDDDLSALIRAWPAMQPQLRFGFAETARGVLAAQKANAS